MTLFNIERAFKIKKERDWHSMYWAIDLHDTIFKGKYSKWQAIEFYPHAQEVLMKLSESPNVLILYSSSYVSTLHHVKMHLFQHHNIKFKYINENPEYVGTDYADFSKKFYFNILLDDKAGFEGEKDWLTVKNELIRIGEWK